MTRYARLYMETLWSKANTTWFLLRLRVHALFFFHLSLSKESLLQMLSSLAIFRELVSQVLRWERQEVISAISRQWLHSQLYPVQAQTVIPLYTSRGQYGAINNIQQADSFLLISTHAPSFLAYQCTITSCTIHLSWKTPEKHVPLKCVPWKWLCLTNVTFSFLEMRQEDTRQHQYCFTRHFISVWMWGFPHEWWLVNPVNVSSF